MYAPFMKLVTGTVEMNQLGVGIGFFNLMTGIGPSLFIAITGKLLTMTSLAKDVGLVEAKGALFSNILLIYAALLAVSILVFLVNKKSYKN